jgi:hypothetical protein
MKGWRSKELNFGMFASEGERVYFSTLTGQEITLGFSQATQNFWKKKKPMTSYVDPVVRVWQLLSPKPEDFQLVQHGRRLLK